MEQLPPSVLTSHEEQELLDKYANIVGHITKRIACMLAASRSYNECLDLWESNADHLDHLAHIVADNICIIVLENFRECGKPEKSKWVKYASLEKLVVCHIRETSREHWNFSSQEDTRLFRCEAFLVETFFEIIEGLQRLRLINRNMDNISLCAYSELILKWTPQQIKEESCFKLAVAEARALPG